MNPAPEYTELGGGLCCWQAYDVSSKVDLWASTATVGRQLFFVDPVPLAASALGELTEGLIPAGVLLTSANHARAAEEFRRRFKVPVSFHPQAAGEIGVIADLTWPEQGGLICGDAFEAIPLTGGAPGETALYRAEAGGLLIVGDAVINLPSLPLSVLPAKYCTDTKRLRRALTTLLDRPFERMLFAHGEPILRGARERLAAVLPS